jgi:hypothetical protein
MAASSVRRVAMPRIPAFRVDAIDAPQLKPAPLQRLGECADHAPVFPFVETALGGRKDERSRPGVTELEELHVTVQGRAVPAVVFAVHVLLERQRRQTSEFRFQQPQRYIHPALQCLNSEI